MRPASFNPARASLVAVAALTVLAAKADERRVFELYNQFTMLNAKAEPLGSRRGVADDEAWLCKHYQSITRSQTSGTPYFFITRSGNETGTCLGQGDDPGELVVVKLVSRGISGERLRSNKLQLDKRFDDSAPYSSDTAVVSIHFNGFSGDGYGNIWPGWCHLGGAQLIDDVLIIPVEHNFTTGVEEDGGLVFVDVSNPLAPRLIKVIDLNIKIGAVGVTKEPDGRYLFVMGGSGWDENALYFIKSLGTTLDENFAFNIFSAATWYSDNDPDSGDNAAWDEDGWQTVNFVRDTDGTLGIITMSDSDDIEIGRGRTRLWYVNQNAGQFDLDLWASRDLGMKEPTTGDMDAGSGVYVSPTGQLLIYVCEHLSNGPQDSIRIGEFRNWNMTHHGSVDCGGWITLYENTTGWSDRDSQSHVIDYVDYHLEEWYDLRDYEDHAGDLNGFSDEAESVRWRIPPGRYGLLYKDENSTGGALFLDGTGAAFGHEDLADFGMDNEITSVAFSDRGDVYVDVPPNNCLIAGGLGSQFCPYVGPTSVQTAANRIGAPPCFSAHTLFLGGGTYTQEVYINRAMTLSVWNSGPVTIVGP